jgi:predicted protein tyrosine phosphatase
MYFVRPWLAIGKYVETTDEDFYAPHGITAMLQLAEPVEQPGVESLFLVVNDGQTIPQEKLQKGIDFICEQKAAGKVVLSACGAGISRSVIFAWGAMVQAEKLDFFEAYRLIQQEHPQAQPHLTLCISLAEYFKLDLTPQDIVNGLYS